MEHNTQLDYTQSSKVIHVEQLNNPVFINRNPDDKTPSYGGHGTLEILEVTQLLDGASICCCLDWEVCVPTEKLREASALMESIGTYEVYPSRPPDLWSLFHTFPRFKLVGKALAFTLIPSEDAHIDCVPSNIERSRMGLPYPTLEIFAQSLLDTNNMVALTDLIDGMNLTEQWGSEHLKLDGKNDSAWIQQKNERIRASVPLTPDSCLYELGISPINLRDTWNTTVQTKERRTGAELGVEYWATRFRYRGSEDPRTTERHHA
ncbi:hypothetical protein OPT61_g5608 [Boeremia exigua]|uniref:Uncharacterized protein n=1 Tax=Boeremia exigua TaxID=749465 RepID=A0ACC2I9M8_9PLEO|nr:hypothetical protein OPT61_g5608 [Boeremia exigua]